MTDPVEIEVKKSNLGQTLTFTFEDVDYSSYSARINIWTRDGTKIVKGDECIVVYDDPNTVASYILTASGTQTIGNYNGEISFYSGSSFLESSKTFKWEIKRSGEGL